MVVPVLFGTAVVLFQFGILFIAYLSLVQEMRDIGRYAAVHPNTVDTGVASPTVATCTNAASGSLFRRACDDLPSVIDPNRVTFSVVQGSDGQTRSCATLTNSACPNRPAYSELRMRLQYDASTIIFLPTTFNLGPFLRVAMPTALPAYDYSVMVEQH